MTGNKEPLISVIIPAYNHERYVQDTIRSIINQTYQNIELIVIDDGSKDKTWDQLQQIRPECDKRFTKVIFKTKQNEGTCATFNQLISKASGEYIYIIASDDIALPSAIEKLYKAITENKYCLAVGNENFINKDGQIVGVDGNLDIQPTEQALYHNFCDLYKDRTGIDYFASTDFGSYRSLLQRNYIPNGSLADASALKKITFVKEAPLEDWFMHLQLAKYGKYKFVNEILFSYRLHGSNTISNKQHMLDMTAQTMQYEIKLCNTNIKQKEILRKNSISHYYLNLGFFQIYKRKILAKKLYCIYFLNHEFIIKEKGKYA